MTQNHDPMKGRDPSAIHALKVAARWLSACAREHAAEHPEWAEGVRYTVRHLRERVLFRSRALKRKATRLERAGRKR